MGEVDQQAFSEAVRMVRALGDLRVAAVAGARIEDALGPVCDWHRVSERTSPADFADARPHLLLLEATGDRGTPPDRVSQLLAYAQETGARSAIWLTDAAPPGTAYAQALAQADAVFATDPGGGRRLVDFDPRAVIGLPDAASRGALAALPGSRERCIGLVVDGACAWHDQATPIVETFLEQPGDYPLSVLSLGAPPADLPPRLGDAMVRARGEDDRIAFIARCGALVAPAPRGASGLYTPMVAFDAVALGTPVILPPGRGHSWTLPGVGASLRDGVDPGPEVARLLDHGEISPGRRAAARLGVRNEHTYPHRLATIASVMGWPLMARGAA